MNFSQLHERLRLEVLRRIERGALSGAMLARQTGFRQSHISNFLHRKRALSLEGLDRILSAQSLSVTDLLELGAPVRISRGALRTERETEIPAITAVPVVTPAAAIHEPQPSPHSTLDALPLSSHLLAQLRPRRSAGRRGWARFVALQVSAQQAAGMEPLLSPDSLAVVDRHYNSLHPSIFAIRAGNQILLRYTTFELNRLILRPHSLSQPVRLLTLGPHETPADLVVGRVCLALSSL